MTCQELVSDPNPASAAVGTSGKSVSLLVVETAKAFNLPLFTKGVAPPTLIRPISTCPPTKAAIPGPAPPLN